MSETRHTAEPWKTEPTYNNGHSGTGYRWGITTAKTQGGCVSIVAETVGRLDKLPDGPHATWDHMHANAQRIVSCVNACAGINPEAVPGLVAALRNARNVLAGLATGDLKCVTPDSPALQQCRAALRSAGVEQ